jgi:hypothetical protein
MTVDSSTRYVRAQLAGALGLVGVHAAFFIPRHLCRIIIGKTRPDGAAAISKRDAEDAPAGLDLGSKANPPEASGLA